MRVNHVDSIIKSLLSAKHCLEYHMYAYEIFFTEMYLRRLGITFNGNKCPFCGRDFNNLFLHLVNHRSRCYKQLRELVKHALRLYRIAQGYISKSSYKKVNGRFVRRYYCRKCGFNGFYFQVIYHVLLDHINDTVW